MNKVNLVKLQGASRFIAVVKLRYSFIASGQSGSSQNLKNNSPIFLVTHLAPIHIKHWPTAPTGRRGTQHSHTFAAVVTSLIDYKSVKKMKGYIKLNLHYCDLKF
jgi:hypothetical protein